MVKSLNLGGTMKIAAFLAIAAAAHIAMGQDPLLRIQHSTAALDIESNAKHAQGFAGVTTGNPGDVWHYPNSVSCLLVYGDGKYVYEKREEATVGRPKVKLAEGSFSADELQQIKTLLADGALQKISSPPMPKMPDDAVAVHEIETLNVRISRELGPQEFMTVKERLKTTALTGLDTWADNGAPYQKTLAPLLKWFKDVEKKAKSGLKEAKPQYCAPMNIG